MSLMLLWQLIHWSGFAILIVVFGAFEKIEKSKRATETVAEIKIRFFSFILIKSI